MIAHLKQDHDRIRDLANGLEYFLDQATPPCDPEFAQLRWKLVRELSMHLANERHALAQWKALGDCTKGDMDFALDDAFTCHIVTWTGATMAAKWDGYCRETRALLGRLRRRMDFEEASIFSTMDGLVSPDFSLRA